MSYRCGKCAAQNTGEYTRDGGPMLGRLLPRETSFFDFFEQHAELSVQSAHKLVEMMQPNANMREVGRAIKDLEHKGDNLTHTCMEALHRTFITPIDRD